MRLRYLILGLLLIAIGATVAWLVHVAYFSTPRAGEPISVIVRDGDTPKVIGEHLAGIELVPSAWIYNAFSAIHDSARHPKAGTYAFRQGSSLKFIADTIAEGPMREIETIRIMEGETIRGEAEMLAAYGVDTAAFVALAGSSPTKTSSVRAFDPSFADNFPILRDIPAGQSLEGYLFPDTYEVWKDQLPQGLIDKQLKAFEKKVVDVLDADRSASGMTWHEVLTLASIVEAEVRTPEDRRIVAGLFLNRLKNGMRIQSDATLNYVIGAGRARATAEDLAFNSPYNSYERDGLPPGPIGNPSFSAINAVLHAEPTDYLFFLTDEAGKVYYAKTYSEHLQNKAKAYGN